MGTRKPSAPGRHAIAQALCSRPRRCRRTPYAFPSSSPFYRFETGTVGFSEWRRFLQDVTQFEDMKGLLGERRLDSYRAFCIRYPSTTVSLSAGTTLSRPSPVLRATEPRLTWITTTIARQYDAGCPDNGRQRLE
jgi:hypothetical protein